MLITIDEACRLLKNEEVVALPTETVYGLAATLSSTDAIGKIFSIKKRPSDRPLTITIADKDQVHLFAHSIPKDFHILAETFWPGPLTLVLPAQKEWVPDVVRGGLDTVAFRIPSHPLTLKVLSEVGPLVLPSANLSGKPSATCVSHVERDFGQDFPVLDGGESQQGIESTILLSLDSKWYILRLGAITPDLFEPYLGYTPKLYSASKPLKYTSSLKLILDKPYSNQEAIIGFEDRTYCPNATFFSLGDSHHPEEALKKLYEILRHLEDLKITEVWVDTDFPKTGLFLTLEERLQKV